MSYQQEKFTAIANNIRACLKTNEKIKPSDFAEKVSEVFEAGKKSQYNKFWDEFQDNGNRRDYSYAFSNAAIESLIPKYKIVADKIMYAFMGCLKLVDISNFEIEVINSNPNMMYVFANCIKMVKGPKITFIAPIIKTYTSMYAGCQSLVDMSVYWGDGTKDPITQRNSCQNMFFKCYKLKNIDFGAENTGSPLHLDLSYSTELTVESLRSLKNSLIPVDIEKAQTEKSVHEIKISTVTMDKIENEAPELLAEFNIKGWTLIEVERPT